MTDPDPQRAEEPPDEAPGPAPDIPDLPEGTPLLGEKRSDVDEGSPVGPTPPFDFWKAIYGRRSIRKFRPDPVPRELVDQVMHAGIWAPSSCNYQMWDFVAVDDPDVNARLAALSLQMGNAPVNVVVAYGREFSEEGWANVQSASAAIENMSLAAQVMGLGTFWITQMGDREKVREIVGLPEDRLVVAVLAVGYPKVVPTKGPKRRPMAHVTHWNHYAGRPIPSSTRPEDWDADLLAVYQRARVLNGLRHNKPRPWEVVAIEQALERFVPDGRALPGTGSARTLRWLDVLPCTGIVTEKLYRERPGYAFDVVERTPEVAEFVASRTRPRAGMRGYGSGDDSTTSPGGARRTRARPGEVVESSPLPLLPAPEAEGYDVVSCLFRLENLPAAEREALISRMARWVKPGGRLLLAYVNKRSFHDLTEWVRSRRRGPGGVEYVLAPDPNIGPFEALEPADVERMVASAGLTIEGSLGCQAVPPKEEIEFRTRNFSKRARDTARGAGWILSQIEKLPMLEEKRGRFQFLSLRR
jgi:nitroreductase/SAM-dependent methyltransferase